MQLSCVCDCLRFMEVLNVMSGVKRCGFTTSVFAAATMMLAGIGLRPAFAEQHEQRATVTDKRPMCWRLVDEEEGEVVLRTRLVWVDATSFLVTGTYTFASGEGIYPVHGSLQLIGHDWHMNLTTTNFGDVESTHFVSNLQFDFRLDPATLSGSYEGIGPLLWGGEISTTTVKGVSTFLNPCP